MARKFYYDTGEEKVGPVTGQELVRLRAAGKLLDDTWVRREDSATWRPLHSVNLREEEEEEANPGLFKVLWRSGLLLPLLLVAVGLVIFILLAVGALSVFWPLVLFILMLWFVNRLFK
ncbi:MAG: DUF4339 domain-containing protein [Akkermansia sp.]|nr:DUF4339 domain-containing protein [Akkermansia sp.]